MFEDYQICPYTGLRSFTEEESIYFKGRDEHIQQATSLLEKNKFLMLTGASGDGKSSLVFAGIIPNAKSGFLKSKYSNWSVVSFRPERSPLKNLSWSLAVQLDIPNIKTVESELAHGFSALIDLYKSSKRYLDEDSMEWKRANDEEKAAIKREATNLIILADQFEEFFTNPENYHQGVPSEESSLTVNLLLETAKLALEQNLPIYIVFTMRSDYIGQCAAFRGLPEYIGFSQFFVPRLNRAQLQQVIEEPATLSGNKISRRLTERLILDITEDVDQLPILQHALSQIWSKASNGAEEMDLLHYAMVGGMSENELPPEDLPKFKEWFGQRPEKIQACYSKPSLHNVIDTHANKLLVFATDYYYEKTGQILDEEIVVYIVKATFTCLTKIDQGRAVRNRMTLLEIKNVIGKPGIDTDKIGVVLDQFREPGNTFFRPFISEEEELRKSLKDDDVLDITHESLIRNWQLLGDWAQEEFNNYSIYQDYYQQVERWVENDKSRGFLLPIGPLTFFENWFKELNPNAHWINRYLKIEEEKESSLEEATEIISNSKEFLKRSAAKHAVTRMVMRYGPRKIAAVIAIMALLVFSSFYIVEMLSRRNKAVMAKIEEDAISLLNNQSTQMLNKQIYVLFQERLNPGRFETILSQLDNDLERAKVATGVAIEITVNDRFSHLPLKKRSILYADSTLSLALNSPVKNNKEILTALIDFIDITEYANFHLDDPDLKVVLTNQAKVLGGVVLDILQSEKGSNWNMKEINEGIELALNHKGFSDEQLENIVGVLSPFAVPHSDFIRSLYPQSKMIFTGTNQDQFAYNGLYQELAGLYAAQGNLEMTFRCLDTLYAYHPNYDDYAVDGYTISGYFIAYQHWDKFEEFAKSFSKLRGHSAYKFYEIILDRSLNMSQYNWWRFNSIFINVREKWFNPILEYQDLITNTRLFKLYENSIKKDLTNLDESNFALAQLYKRQGITMAKWREDKSLKIKDNRIDELFNKSLEHFKLVSNAYLEEEIKFTYTENTRRELYKYPDYHPLQSVYEPRESWSGNYKTTSFFNWIATTGKFNEFYSKADELEQIMKWLEDQNIATALNTSTALPISANTLAICDSIISQHSLKEQINKNLLILFLANKHFESGEPTIGIETSKRLNYSSLSSISTDPNNFFRSNAFQNVCNAYSNLVINGMKDMADSLLIDIKSPRNRAGIYGYTSANLALADKPELSKIYLDSALNLINSLRSINSNFWDYRKNIAYAISLQNEEFSKVQAQRFTRNMNNFIRQISNGLITRGVIHKGDYYPAYSGFPKFISPDTKLFYINNILYENVRAQKDQDWALYHENYNWFYEIVGHQID